MATTSSSRQHLASNSSTYNHNPSSQHFVDNMFSTLNRFISRFDAATEQEPSKTQGFYGFQVLKNTNGDVPLEPWFDFIIGINGRTLDSADPNLFATEVRNCAGTTIRLGIFGAKGQVTREVFVPVDAEKPTLGISLQWAPLAATEDVWHILDVAPNSPADAAGLLPYGDYVIGSPEGVVHGESGLGELIEDFIGRPLRLIVYNHEYNVTRPVTITPARGWGGEGALGCVLGFGALHRIPASLEEPPQAPGETLFSTESASFDEKRPASMEVPPIPGAGAGTELFVPANMALPSRSPPPGSAAAGPPKRKQRAHHPGQADPSGGGLDDYFKEGEQKSKEDDYAPKGKTVPPPPKAGGPPRGPPKSGTPVQAESEAETQA